ncbi:MAG: hypothetical protein N3G75_09245 [Methanothrix sp.]|nr:hypothetical protein [Methanothrix sp.]MCX8207992.1 hypothetical protein [Methanothrix sp.]
MSLSDLEERRSRQFIMYFPSVKDRERWRRLARKARMPLSRWIFETVENHLAEDSQAGFAQKSNLIAENRRLQRELEKSEARIRELETEIFKLKNLYFSRPVASLGVGSFDPALLDILKSGNTWSSRDILTALGIDQSDVDAIDIVTNQLYLLLDLGLVQETPSGWRWVG